MTPDVPAAAGAQTAKLTVKDFTTENKPDWCPGCGDFGILNALKKALVDLKKAPHEVTVVAGIGCSSKLPHWLNTYGFHTLHGRALPIATAVRLGNTKNDVIVISGDGDGYGIGVGHLVHAARRNVNVTMLAHNNQIYGLTTGQASPTTDLGHKTKTTPKGNFEMPVNPLALAIACGAGMVARSSAGDPKHLGETIKEAMQYRGFALIDILQPCVTFNKVNTYAWYKDQSTKLPADWDPTDKVKAFEMALKWGHNDIALGTLFKDTTLASLEDAYPWTKEKPLYQADIRNVDTMPTLQKFI
ncbi:MAG: 2-oxoacid:ferredoxin oxidoreductase subunit beta [Thermoplasmatota archaeon]